MCQCCTSVASVLCLCCVSAYKIQHAGHWLQIILSSWMLKDWVKLWGLLINFCEISTVLKIHLHAVELNHLDVPQNLLNEVEEKLPATSSLRKRCFEKVSDIWFRYLLLWSKLRATSFREIISNDEYCNDQILEKISALLSVILNFGKIVYKRRWQ